MIKGVRRGFVRISYHIALSEHRAVQEKRRIHDNTASIEVAGTATEEEPVPDERREAAPPDLDGVK